MMKWHIHEDPVPWVVAWLNYAIRQAVALGGVSVVFLPPGGEGQPGACHSVVALWTWVPGSPADPDQGSINPKS